MTYDTMKINMKSSPFYTYKLTMPLGAASLYLLWYKVAALGNAYSLASSEKI